MGDNVAITYKQFERALQQWAEEMGRHYSSSSEVAPEVESAARSIRAGQWEQTPPTLPEEQLLLVLEWATDSKGAVAKLGQ